MNEYLKVRKIIKEFTDGCGIAKQCCGHVVDAWKEPKNPKSWFFMLGDQKWTASDYAFKEE